MKARKLLVIIACLAVTVVFAGCHQPFVNVTYHFQSKMPVPADVKKVAVALVQGYTTPEGKVVTGDLAGNELRAKLMKAEGKPYDLIERGPELAGILKEKQFQQSDFAQATSKLASEGKLAGVDAMIWGKITDYNKKETTHKETRTKTVSRTEWYRDNKGNKRSKVVLTEVPYEVTIWDISGNFGVTFKMVKVADGSIIAAGDYPKPFNQQYENKRVMSADQLMVIAQKAAVYDFVKEIAPWMKTVRHPLDKSGGSKGVKAAESGNYALAEDAFRAVLQKEPNNAGALYDLGLMLAAQRKMQEAYESVEKACKIESQKMYLEALKILEGGLGAQKMPEGK